MLCLRIVEYMVGESRDVGGMKTQNNRFYPKQERQFWPLYRAGMCVTHEILSFLACAYGTPIIYIDYLLLLPQF